LTWLEPGSGVFEVSLTGAAGDHEGLLRGEAAAGSSWAASWRAGGGNVRDHGLRWRLSLVRLSYPWLGSNFVLLIPIRRYLTRDKGLCRNKPLVSDLIISFVIGGRDGGLSEGVATIAADGILRSWPA
jgi:hypothetical protein